MTPGARSSRPLNVSAIGRTRSGRAGLGENHARVTWNSRPRADVREYQRTHDRRAYKAAWLKADRAANPEKYAEKDRTYKRTNRRAENEKARRRRTRKLAATLAKITPDQLDLEWKRYKGRCWMCGEPAVEWDHVRPLTKGGVHTLRNLRPACRPCNASKGDDVLALPHGHLTF